MKGENDTSNNPSPIGCQMPFGIKTDGKSLNVVITHLNSNYRKMFMQVSAIKYDTRYQLTVWETHVYHVF